MILMERARKRLEPWQIAAIVVSVVVGLALIIGLLTFFLCRGKYIILSVLTGLQQSAIFPLLLGIWVCSSQERKHWALS